MCLEASINDKAKHLLYHQDVGSFSWSTYAKWWFLMYLLFALPSISLGYAGLRDWLLFALSLIVFLPLYFLGHHPKVQGRRLWLVVLAMTLVGAVYAFWNSGAWVYFVLSTVIISYRLPEPWARWAVWAITVLYAITFWLTPWKLPIYLIFWGSMMILLGGYFGIFQLRAVRQVQALREQERFLAALAERERISQDLHDLLGYTLSLIALKAELARRLAECGLGEAIGELSEIEEISRRAVQQLRSVVHNEFASSVREELEALCRALRAAGIEPKVELAVPELPQRLDAALTFILREAVTNVIRHSGARHCWIRLAEQEGWVFLEVRDDGRGPSPRRGEGLGLSGIQKRVKSLQGSCEHLLGSGFTLRVQLPRTV